MTIDQFGWRAHISDQFDPAFARGFRRVHLWRRVGDGEIEVITGFNFDGYPVIERRPPGVTDEFRGLAIPAEALQAIAEAVKPGPSTGELARLSDQLAVEQHRVDKLLDATIDRVVRQP